MANQDNETPAADTRTVVYLGNHNSVAVVDGERVADPGKRCTTVSIPGDATLMEAAHDITGPNGLWTNMSFDPAPAWVAGTGPLAEALLQILSAHYKCEVRDVDLTDAGA